MPCPYYNKEKESIGDGIYCNYMGGRPGVKYWNCYCDHRYSDCPIYGGDDPYELDPRTRERKKREEDKAKAQEVVRLIGYISYSVSENDERAIENARYAYNRLTSDQKGYVNNYNRLSEAERALQRVKSEKQSAKQAEKQRSEQSRQKEWNNSSQKQKNQAKTTYTSHSREAQGEDDGREWYIDEYGNKLYKAPPGYRSKVDLWEKLNPRWNPQPRLVIVSRVALAVISVLAWYQGLPYNTPEAVEWLYLIFGCGQLISMIVSYICPNAKKLRLVLWSLCLVSLAAMILLIYLNYNTEMVVFLVLISFGVPLFWIGSKVAVVVARFIVEHFL